MLEELEKLICDLVAIESVNPDLVPGGAGEGAIAGCRVGTEEATECHGRGVYRRRPNDAPERPARPLVGPPGEDGRLPASGRPHFG